MNYLTPDLYRDFQCIAGACPNTCCVGWQIIIDKETGAQMKEKEALLGIPAKDWLYDEDDITYVRLNDRRCPMLNENNLCRVVLKLGDSYLSQTCRQYPRMFTQYGGVVEAYLNMSCPQVISSLMDRPVVMFDFSEDDLIAAAYPHTGLYLYEAATRNDMIDVLQGTPDISLQTRLFTAFTILEESIRLYQDGRPDADILQKDIQTLSQANILYALEPQVNQLVSEANRYHFLQQLTANTQNFRKGSERFARLVKNTGEYFGRNCFEQYVSDMQAFRSSFCPAYAAFYTNYWVYRIFSDFLSIPEYEKAKEKFIFIATEFALIQAIALAAFSRKGSLDREEYIYIISYLSRELEHSQSVHDDILSRLNGNNMISVAGLMMLTIV